MSKHEKKVKKAKKPKKSKKSKKEGHCDRKGGSYGAFADVMDGLFERISIKLWFFLFIIFILANTAEFIQQIIGKFEGTLDGRYLSTKGIIVQASMVCISMIVIEVLINEDLL
jgi:hypothetical protein